MEHNTGDNDNSNDDDDDDKDNDGIIDDTDDEDNGNSINKMILRILDIGILFGYLCTIDIVHLLTSSHILLNFKGIYSIH